MSKYKNSLILDIANQIENVSVSPVGLLTVGPGPGQILVPSSISQSMIEGQLSGTIPNGTYMVTTSARYSFRITGIYGLKSTSGSGNLTITINGENVIGLVDMPVSVVPHDVLATGNNTVEKGDSLALVVSDIADLNDLFSTLDIVRL